MNHPKKKILNLVLLQKRNAVETALLERPQGIVSSAELKSYLLHELNPAMEEDDGRLPFLDYMNEFASSKEAKSTRDSYMYTISKVKSYTKEKLAFESITYAWLKRFDAWLKDSCSVNTRSIHMRNIRATFNEAIKNDLITCYPFRKFSIAHEKTEKRGLTISQLRSLKDFPCERYQEQYRDIFMLMFYLIGINMKDLLYLKHTDVRDGRIHYRRSKTGGLFSIKLEPEAIAIINKYKGRDYLLNPLDRYGNYKDFLHRMNDTLKKIGEVERKGPGGKKYRDPAFPTLTSYYSRHTWATLAYKLGVPKDTISLALGHEWGCRTTSIYIDFDMDKVDEANRKVIDYCWGKQL